MSTKGDSTMGPLDNIKFNAAGFFNIGGAKKAEGAKETTSAASTGETAAIVSQNTTTRSSLDDTQALSNRAKINSPAAQGLASAEQIQNGQLVGPYHFDSLGDYNSKLFTLKYNSANTPSIAKGTDYACENIEFTGVAGNLAFAAKDTPFAELFS